MISMIIIRSGPPPAPVITSRTACKTLPVPIPSAAVTSSSFFLALAAVVRDAYATLDHLGPASLERVRADLTTRHAAELVDDLLPSITAGLDQP